MATGPYTNFLKFRLNRTKPLNYSDLDNNFRFPNQWGPDQSYSQGMMVVSYDFGFTASDSISMWIADSDHTSTNLNAPGLTGGIWTPIAIPSAGYIGPTGYQGFQGAQGAGSQGFQGHQGTQGPTGFQGTQGFQGIQGFQGHTGYQGFQGIQGFQGAKGDQGFQGVQGTTGSQGNTGSQGPFGFQGDQGFQGAKGDQGFQGFTGFQGPQGFTGFQGHQGFQGNQGFQGFTGLNGISGTSGVQGFQGPLGDQGFQGFDTSLLSINTQTSNYSLVLSDKGKLIKMQSSGNLTLEVPLNSSQAFSTGSQILIIRDDTGEVDITPASGVTLYSANSWTKLNNQYSSATLIKFGTNDWYLIGDLKP